MRLLVSILFALPGLANAEYWPLIRVDYESVHIQDHRRTAQYLGLDDGFRSSMDLALQEARNAGIRVTVESMYRPQYLQDQMRLWRLATNHPTPIAIRSNHTRRQAVDISFDHAKVNQWDQILNHFGLYRPLRVKDKNHVTWLPSIHIPYRDANYISNLYRPIVETVTEREAHIPLYHVRANEASRQGELRSELDQLLLDLHTLAPTGGHQAPNQSQDNSWHDNFGFSLPQIEVPVFDPIDSVP